jgi:hypothetical protein
MATSKTTDELRRESTFNLLYDLRGAWRMTSHYKARRGSALADAIALLSMSYAGSKLHEHIVRDAEIKRELSIVLFESDMVMRVLQSEDRSLYSQALEDVRRSEPFFR